MEFLRVVTIFLCFGALRGIIPPSQQVDIREAPYFVYVSDGAHYCGGCIIQNNIILTAAHCIREFMTNIKEIEVIAGTVTPHSKDKNAQKQSVIDAVIHDGYKLGENQVQAYNDIALLKLTKPFRTSWNIQPIKIGRFNSYAIPLAYGFGSTHETFNDPSDYLLRKNVSYIPDKECQEMLAKTITKSIKQEYEICLTTSYCNGDSGSPLIQMHYGTPRVVGVASWVADDIYGCGTPPAVALHVAAFSDWLQEALKKLSKK